MLPKVKFQKLRCKFQEKLNMDIKKINSLTKKRYKKLLLKPITKTYKRANPNTGKSIMEQGKKITNKKGIFNRKKKHFH